jgi:hypothetical protein
MLPLLLRIALGGALAGAALAKLAAPGHSRDALATFGLSRPHTRVVALAALVCLELGLAAGVIAGLSLAVYAAAALQLCFAAALTWALRRGRRGAPCGCFGPRSRVGPAAVVRNVVLAGGFAAILLVPTGRLGTEEWLAAGLGVALLGVAGLTVAVLALAREVGELRLALGPQAALEIASEGPELGGRSDLIERFELDGGSLALAVFVSDGCPICSSLRPTVDFIAREGRVALAVFDEHRDVEAWRALEIPGAPYAVAFGRDGTVLAKGTFNTLPQLESVLATAERRAVGVPVHV